MKSNENKKAIGIVFAVILAVSVLTAAIPGIASEPSNTPVTAEPRGEIGIEERQRDLPAQVYVGSSFNVSINFTAPADNVNSIGLTEEANETANMTVEGKKEWCTPEADFVKITDNKIEILWYGPYDANTAFTVVYKVSVPSGAEEGSYAFNGSVEYYIGGEGPYEETMGGDKEVKVVTAVPSEGVARTPTPTPTLTPEVTPTPETTPTPPGFEVVFAIAVLLSVAYLVLRKKKKDKRKK